MMLSLRPRLLQELYDLFVEAWAVYFRKVSFPKRDKWCILKSTVARHDPRQCRIRSDAHFSVRIPSRRSWSECGRNHFSRYWWMQQDNQRRTLRWVINPSPSSCEVIQSTHAVFLAHTATMCSFTLLSTPYTAYGLTKKIFQFSVELLQFGCHGPP